MDMFLQNFYAADGGRISISADQASRFAKEIAGDFNPLHDADAKRFCVPGDMLFSIVLQKYGLNRQMKFSFEGMVGRDVWLNLPPTDEQRFSICDDAGKSYLTVERDGDATAQTALIEAFLREYVAFSGPNFPHVLVPLMARHDVMINTDRPLVIYESMGFDLQRLDFSAPRLEAAQTELEVNGKRGVARLHFDIHGDGECIGRGIKKLVISGMREYNKPEIDRFVDSYLARMEAYQQARSAGIAAR